MSEPEVTIARPEKFVQGGLTLAHHEGQIVFVHGALPGERVEVQISRKRSGHSFGVTTAVHEVSPDRMNSDCSIFPACGGCSFRHINYTSELELKVALLKEQRHIQPHLDRLKIHSAQPDHYRHHARFHARNGKIGFFAPWTEDIIELPPEGCLQLLSEINAALTSIGTKAAEFSLYVDHNGKVVSSEDRDAELQFRSGSFSWRYRPGLFFQANRFMIEPWLQFMNGILEGSSQRNAVELFCGSGLIGGFLRRHFRNFTGVESYGASLEQARLNFKRSDLEGRFLLRDLYQKRGYSGLSEMHADIWIVNPPRAGMKDPLCQEAIRSPISELLYSSCNPQTLDRDIGILKKAGFSVSDIAAFDFFPRTPHLEIVTLLRR